MLNEVTFRIVGFFLIVAMFVTLGRFVTSLRRYQPYFKKMEKILRDKNIAIVSKHKTASTLEQMHQAVQSKESEDLLLGAKRAQLIVNSRFRVFVVVAIVLAILLAFWKSQGTL